METSSLKQPLTAVLIGAGDRGYHAYAPYALECPDALRFVAVAEPNTERRARFAATHGIPPEAQFTDWRPLLAGEKRADAAFVTTLDRQHTGPALAALEQGYDVLLEKPMATTLEECVRLVQAAERTGRLLQICHVLRYAPFFEQLHEIVASGRLGEVLTVEHRENVSYWHMAHSYVRGNWRRSDVESPMILAKCCHDLDILTWNLGQARRLSSFGQLQHFRPEKAPPGAPAYCLDGCPAAERCPWYAPRLYVELVPLLRMARRAPRLAERVVARLSLARPGLTRALRRLLPPLDAALDYRGWPVSVISEDDSPEARLEALRRGPYGRCVYRCDNDVVDHQVVNLELESGATVAFTMHGHAHCEGRTLRYDGSRATLRGCFYPYRQQIEIHDHLTGERELIRFPTGGMEEGHGGGDRRLVAGFVQAARGTAPPLTTARASLESHLLAFAAEEARIEGQVVGLADYRHRAEAHQA